MFETSFNWLAVGAVTVGYMVIGALWYGPLFQKPWMQLTGITEESAKAGAAKSYAMMLIVALISVLVLAMLVLTIGAETFVEGMLIGLWIWVGFQATIMLNGVIFEKKPMKLYMINVGYNLVMLLIGGGVLAIWQ